MCVRMCSLPGLASRRCKEVAAVQELQDTIQTSTFRPEYEGNWVYARKHRITASNFGKKCKMRETTCCAANVTAILYPENLERLPVIKHGVMFEKTAIEKYEELNGVVVERYGFFVDVNHSFLGAMPDGLLGKDGLLEVKCPLSLQKAKLSPVEAAVFKKDFYLERKNGIVQLKRNHDYFFQVQGQLHVTQRKLCDFAVYSMKDLFQERIQRDDHFWKTKMLLKLMQFYMECILPEIVDSRQGRSMPFRERSCLMLAKEKRNVKGSGRKMKQKSVFMSGTVNPPPDSRESGSENDPEHLWCVCKKPHNNRFMICCDACEDWYHGTCVGITQQTGHELSNKNQEWMCSKCKELDIGFPSSIATPTTRKKKQQ